MSRLFANQQVIGHYLWCYYFHLLLNAQAKSQEV